MIKRRAVAIFFSAMLIQTTVNAQIKNGNYAFTLKLLLSRDVPEMTIEEAGKSQARLLFLDARELPEYNVSHLPGALFIGYNHFSSSPLKHFPKNKYLVVYCSIGKRSEGITRKLAAEGFTNVHNLYGGIFEWVNQGHAVVDMQNQPTTRVHAYGKFWGKFLNRGTKVY